MIESRRTDAVQEASARRAARLDQEELPRGSTVGWATPMPRTSLRDRCRDDDGGVQRCTLGECCGKLLAASGAAASHVDTMMRHSENSRGTVLGVSPRMSGLNQGRERGRLGGSSGRPRSSCV